MDAAIRVLVVDDHEVVRRGLCDLLRDQDDLTVCGEAGTAAEAIARAEALQPDVAVVDVRLPDGDGVSVCRQLRETAPSTSCLMLTSYADDDAMVAAVEAGAAGFLLKQVRGLDIVSAVRTVAAGGSWLSPGATRVVLDRLRHTRTSDGPALSDRERVVLDLIREGHSNKEIADRMGITEKTVKNYVTSLLHKLHLRGRTQAALYAERARTASAADPRTFGSAERDFRPAAAGSLRPCAQTADLPG